MPLKKISLLNLVLLSLLMATACQTKKLPRKFKLPDELPEVSGLYYAGLDSLWWHNDGGDRTLLYLTDERGSLRSQVLVPEGNNVDWEDITADDDGVIYIGDFGNNGNRRRDLRIYLYNPTQNDVDSILFKYPDQGAFPPTPEQANFDMEGFFWANDSLHLFSKNRLEKGNDYTKHYVLPAVPGKQVPELRDSVYLKKRVVSGAAISPDGQRVVLLTYWYKKFLGFIPVNKASVFVLDDFRENDYLKGTLRKQKIPGFLVPLQYEAIDFRNREEIIVAREKVLFFKQKARRMHLKGPSKRVVP